MSPLLDDGSDPDGAIPHTAGVGVLADDLKRYLRYLIEGDRDACERIVDRALAAGVSIPCLYERLMKPALYRIGEMWACNEISVATEHLATTITESLLNRVYPRVVNPRRTGRQVVLATVEDELHQIGLKMAGDIFEMNGWDAHILDAGGSIDELMLQLDREHPDAVGLSFSVYFHLDRLQEMLRRIRAGHPDLPILIGGQGLTWGGRELVEAHGGVTCIESLDVLDSLLGQVPAWTGAVEAPR